MTTESSPKYTVLLGVPAYRYIEVATARFIAETCAYVPQRRPDIRILVDMVEEFPAAGCRHCYEQGKDFQDARNRFVKKALDLGCTHLCMIDADMDRALEQRDSFMMLAGLIDADRDVIVPLFIRRSHPYDFLARRYDPATGKREPITQAEAESGSVIDGLAETGGGMMLIRRSVLEALKFPYFCFEWHNGSYLPEDVNFCRKAKAKGFGVSCHTAWHLDHLGRHRYSPKVGMAIAANKQQARDKWANGVLADRLKKLREEFA